MTITIYHNPNCGTSRNVLAVLQGTGEPLEVIAYLATPPTRERLTALLRAMGMTARDLLRRRGTPFEELGLGDPALGEDALVQAMVQHPILINRPVVVAPRGVRLCRPSEIVFDLIAPPAGPDLQKEDGAPLLVDCLLEPADAGLRAALAAAGLPVDDLAEPDRRFYGYRTTGGTLVGYGGFELVDRDALLRSITTLPEHRGRGIAKGITALLLRRAFDQGARCAWLLTTDAAPYFAGSQFRPVDRSTAPVGIRATRQFTSLCPAAAVLMRRAIEL